MRKAEKLRDNYFNFEKDLRDFSMKEDLYFEQKSENISADPRESEEEEEEEEEEVKKREEKEEENSIENSSEYSDLNFCEITEQLDFSFANKLNKYKFIASKSSENLKDLTRTWKVSKEVDNKRELLNLDNYNNIITSRDYFQDSNFKSKYRSYSSEQDIRLLQLEVFSRPENEKESPKSKFLSNFHKLKYTPLKSEFKIKNKNFRIVWEIEKRQKALRKLVILPPLEDYRELVSPNLERRRNLADFHKKKVRFSMSKMESDLNFRATLSIKNEADGQTVFYKIDKNRFQKEKTIKLMVESMYRVDISFKPTQTLARALVRGREVKIVERAHDSTASAYSLHLSTRNVQPTAKGHRDEVTLLIQFANDLVLQTSLQVKFYKPGDTQHCEWGSTFHCVEYDCEPFPENGVISIIKETFR